MNTKYKKLFGLYVIIDPQITSGRDVFTIANSALDGGANILQLRDKINDKRTVVSTARELRKMCDKSNALLIINDYVDVAVLSDADGVHVGQHDLSLCDTRKFLSPNQIIGSSNAMVEEAVESDQQGADYIAIGSIFKTATKSDTRPAGLETLREVRNRISRPIVAIGGITKERVHSVVQSGADAICVAGAIGLSSNPELATKELVESISLAGAKTI